MIVAGGSYLEICLAPQWRRIFGSGGRAAIAISSRSSRVELHTYAGEDFADDVVQTMRSLGIRSNVRRIAENISFSYFHPLSPAQLFPAKPRPNKSLKVAGDTVLRFGFVEGDAIVQADYAVYDPQGGPPLEKFEKNGSKARHLTYVLNENEILALTQKSSMREAATALLGGATEVVIVKRGPEGAVVFQKADKRDNVPAYESERIFKIGSGDVFSAIFAYEWGENKLSPVDAADAASRAVAYYVESRSLHLTSRNVPANLNPSNRPVRIRMPAWDRSPTCSRTGSTLASSSTGAR